MFKKGYVPWNKGKDLSNHPYFSQKLRGKHLSLKTEFKKGMIPWNKGKKGLIHSDKWFSVFHNRIGKNHPNWKGGISRNKHSLSNPKYKQWRSDVFQRDNWTCQTCGERSESGNKIYLEAHHVKSWAKHPKLRFDIDNGITLCRECHKLTDNYKNKK